MGLPSRQGQPDPQPTQPDALGPQPARLSCSGGRKVQEGAHRPNAAPSGGPHGVLPDWGRQPSVTPGTPTHGLTCAHPGTRGPGWEGAAPGVPSVTGPALPAALEGAPRWKQQRAVCWPPPGPGPGPLPWGGGSEDEGEQSCLVHTETSRADLFGGISPCGSSPASQGQARTSGPPVCCSAQRGRQGRVQRQTPTGRGERALGGASRARPLRVASLTTGGLAGPWHQALGLRPRRHRPGNAPHPGRRPASLSTSRLTVRRASGRAVLASRW